ncbi:hypothetical protein HPP92_020603 [Vanilla planifolia]|uniref:Uncharacterized protein n=1 Tax=Vanilla planifolia TaxID=51239 RepID=A0A835UHR6_VANPL|nr:hypothetical protein HPP92_020603 [Vanilla planifolia]
MEGSLPRGEGSAHGEPREEIGREADGGRRTVRRRARRGDGAARRRVIVSRLAPCLQRRRRDRVPCDVGEADGKGASGEAGFRTAEKTH